MSFVVTLTTDTKIVTNPTWADVEREVCALDARAQTLVILAPSPPKGAPEGDHHMAIGGGSDDRFIVYTTEDNLSFWNLTDPEQSGAEGKVQMSIGGQVGDYRKAQLVSRDLALRAARQYVEDGRRAADLIWTAE
jgi:hypothetical protein